MIVVADSSALVALAGCDALPFLETLFHAVRVPDAVFRECVVPAKPESARLEAFPQDKIVAVSTEFSEAVAPVLGKGEVEAMALYRQLNADRLLVDDGRARRAALALGMEIVGSLGVLVRSKELGIIPAVQPLLARAQAAGLYFSRDLIRYALQVAGETPESASSVDTSGQAEDSK